MQSATVFRPVRWVISALFAGTAILVAYYLLPPRGFVFTSPKHLITMLSFLCTALTTGWFAARTNRHRSLAIERSIELARLNQLGNALLDSDDPDVVVKRVADQLVRVYGVKGAVFLDEASGRLFEAGPEARRIDRDRLRRAVSGPFLDSESSITVIAVRETGSLGIVGSELSARSLEAIAERIAVAVAKARAARQSMEAVLLQHAENLKSAVLDALAHEIKGPFATIKVSISTLLSKQPGDAAQQRELLQVADEELERIEGWIDDAIQMSSRQAAELRLNKASHPIGDVIARAIEGLGPQTDGRSIDVEVPESIPSACFDAELIEKVIRQLVDNAIKYSPAGSPIRIRAEYTGAELLVHVADSGCGIPRDEQRRIFEKYYRGRARVSGAPGTGLGLASAKCIMEVHGGEIWVHSVPGSGSIFHISLPVELEASPEQCENLERRR